MLLPVLPGHLSGLGARLEAEAVGCILYPSLVLSGMGGLGQRDWGCSQTRSCFCSVPFAALGGQGRVRLDTPLDQSPCCHFISHEIAKRWGMLCSCRQIEFSSYSHLWEG